MNAARKIGYSFLGLLAGNAALFTFLLVDAKAWETNNIAFYMLPFYLIFSIFGWVLVGIPFVLVIQSEVIIELHWLIVVLIGLFLARWLNSSSSLCSESPDTSILQVTGEVLRDMRNSLWWCPWLPFLSIAFLCAEL